MLSKPVFALISEAVSYPGNDYKYLHAQGVPVVGSGCLDGPDWSDPVNSTNMFALNGCNAQTTSIGEYLKSQGVTKLASIGYGQGASSNYSAGQVSASANAAGVPTVYKNTGLQFGGVNPQTIALAVKKSQADGLWLPVADNDIVAILSALQAIGWPLAALMPNFYKQQAIDDPAVNAAAQGLTSVSNFAPVSLETAPVRTFKDRCLP